ncbi:lysostaphin resistance A-like protein [Chryseobacterium kwangjuense]|uniref:Lysostaphin resistance A-like protein n=1 Tax=Chryseobacterium kwangjuense TaxID=267125 RepID=A0ABW9JZW9_9FLAO
MNIIKEYTGKHSVIQFGLIFSILIAAFFLGLIEWTGMLAVVILAGMAQLYSSLEKNTKYPRFLYHGLAVLIFGLCFVVYQHLIPGFNNVLYFDKIRVSADAVPFTMYFNVDKLLAGLILLLFIIPLKTNFREGVKKIWPLFLMTIMLLLSLAALFHFVRFDFKLHSYFLIWGINNLFIVCMAEEALFRGFLQRHLSLQKIRYSSVIAIVVAGLGFGLLHWQGGAAYVSYAAVAGIMYGWMYQRSQNIFLNILAHFLFNLIHIIFFTYPFLQ